MGALMRSWDWRATSLGAPETWPAALRTTVRLLLNTGHPMYIWWGKDGACLYNDAYRQSIGPERHPRSLGRPARDVWDEIWETIEPQIARVMGGGEATWHENALVPITRNGRRDDVYWTYSYSPIDDETAPNSVGGVLVVCSETTQLVDAQRHLARERRRLATLFEQAPSFIAMLSGPEHRFELANGAYMRLVGDRELIGRTVAEAVPEAAGQGYIEVLDTVYRTGEPFSVTGRSYLTRTEPDSPLAERRLDFVYQAVRDDDGAIVGVFCVGHDNTDTHVAQARLKALTAELQQRVDSAVAEREVALAQLHEVQKIETLGHLTAGVAHDFNNLLTPIMGGIEILSRRLAGDERAERIADGAMRSAERARLLVQRLLAFGRRQMLHSRAVDLATLVAGADELIRQSIGAGIELIVDVPADLPPVEVDPQQCELAVLNLCLNARDAMPNGGTLVLSAGLTDVPGGVALRVSDDGNGMDAATLARSTEPFFTTKVVGAGTGLGLSMVHGLAAQSGGWLTLTSVVGRGTVAELVLPVAVAPPAAHAAAAAPVADHRNGTILLVDDEELVRMAVADGLRELGYTVIEAASGTDALDRLGDGIRPDLLVTDHLMPGMTGAVLASEARVRIAGLPVLMITAYANLRADETLGIEVMSKPFRQADVARRVAGLLKGEARPAA